MRHSTCSHQDCRPQGKVMASFEGEMKPRERVETALK
jgi:hypothetical protein